MGKTIVDQLAELQPRVEAARKALMNDDEMSAGELAGHKAALKQDRDWRDLIAQSDAADALFAPSKMGFQLTEAGERAQRAGTLSPSFFGGTDAGYRNWGASGVKAMADVFAARVSARGGFVSGKSGVFAGGDSGISIPLAPDWTTIPEPIPGLLSVLPSRVLEVGKTWEWLTQVTKDNQAAATPSPIGAPPAVKPTSSYELERRTSSLSLISHLSGPTDLHLLLDVRGLTQFIADQMLAGLKATASAEVVSGSGVSPHVKGLLTTSGIQSIPYSVSPLVSIRKAITAIQVLAQTPDALVLHPTDWEAISLTRNGVDGSGPLEFAAGPTVESTKAVFGLPVVIEAGLPVGTAVVLVKSAATVVYGHEGTQLAYDASGVLFGRNEIVARAEMRIGLEIRSPLFVAKVALA